MGNSDGDLSGAYTDSPRLQSNLILGSMRLLVWFFFHPSAWRNHLVSIDPELNPNFRLTGLIRDQWRNSDLRRLLIMGYVVLSSVAGLSTGLILWLLGASSLIIFFGVVLSIIFGVCAGLVSNLIVGMLASIVIGSTLAAGVGVGAFAQAVGLIKTRGTPIEIIGEALIFGAAFSIFSGISNSLMGGPVYKFIDIDSDHSLVRRTWGIAVGILISGGMLFLGGNMLRETANSLTLMIGIIATLLVGITVSWGRDTIAGVIAALTIGLAFYLESEILPESFKVVFIIAFFIPIYILVERIIGSWASAIAVWLGGSGGWVASHIIAHNLPLRPLLPLNLSIILLGLTLFYWRPFVFYPFQEIWNLLLRRTDERRTDNEGLHLLRWHSAFCDEHQRLRLFGLDEHLLLVMERNPTEGQAALDYLSMGCQRWAARAVQIELDARRLEGCSDVSAIAQAHRNSAAGELEGPISALLRSFKRISQDVDAALSQTSAYNQRLALSAVEGRIDSLIRELTRSSDRYIVRFRPIATTWRQIIAHCRHELAEAVELHQEIGNPYVIGVPLTEQQEIFVGRTDVSAHIEQLLVDKRRPPLLLYGQRRMGKTSLLNNLGRLLPSTIVPLFIDLQGPASQASDHTGSFYNIARDMINAARRQRDLTFPSLTRETLTSEPFTYFDEWLDEVEQVLGNQTALVTLDEFEALDSAITKGNLDGHALLNMLRHIIQHRPRFKILLTSSHSLEEFKRWSSYLINIQVVHISYLNQAEARQLIECPVQDFALRYELAASQRVLSLTQGHPFLVQLLCSEIVALKNEQDPAARRLARLADVEAAIPEALNRSSFFFADIETNQIHRNGLILLRFLAGQGEEAVITRETLHDQLEDSNQADRTLTSLTGRELIEEVNGGFRFQVELIRRWFLNV